MATTSCRRCFLDIEVRPLAPADFSYVVRLHHAALPHGFFVMLGQRFLRLYHTSFMESPLAVALVAEVDGAPAGFLLGTLDDLAHYQLLLHYRGWRWVSEAGFAMAVRPNVAAYFVRTRARRYIRGMNRLRRYRSSEATEHQARDGGVLTHVAVEPECRGRGIGAALVTSFVDLARASGVAELRLATLAHDAGGTRFYQRLGWTQGPSSVDGEGRAWTQFSIRP